MLQNVLVAVKSEMKELEKKMYNASSQIADYKNLTENKVISNYLIL
jgi:hypothetical protein